MTPAQRLAVDFADQLRLRDDVRHYRELFKVAYTVAVDAKREVADLERQLAEARAELRRYGRAQFPQVTPEAQP